MLNYICNFKDIIAIYEVGGTIKKKNKAKDIDLLVILNNSSKNNFEQYIKSFYKYELIDDSIRILNPEEKDISLALYYENEIKEKIISYSKLICPLGEKREWAFGYWIPEIFIDDILNSKVLYITDQSSENLIEFTKKNKKHIEKNIKYKIKKEIALKIDMLNCNNKFVADALKIDIIMAIFRFKQLQKETLKSNFLDIYIYNSDTINKLYDLETDKFIIHIQEIMREVY